MGFYERPESNTREWENSKREFARKEAEKERNKTYIEGPMMIDGREILQSSLKVESKNWLTRVQPDGYFTGGQFKDGGYLDAEQLKQLTDQFPQVTKEIMWPNLMLRNQNETVHGRLTIRDEDWNDDGTPKQKAV